MKGGAKVCRLWRQTDHWRERQVPEEKEGTGPPTIGHWLAWEPHGCISVDREKQPDENTSKDLRNYGWKVAQIEIIRVIGMGFGSWEISLGA